MSNFVVFFGFVVGALSAWGQGTRYPVSCEDRRECPGWVLGLVHPQGVCSGFLVASDIIATNLHCIPPEIHKPGESCRGKISFHFPETHRFKLESFECDSIIDISPPLVTNSLSTDYAFLKVSQTVSREIVEIDRSGFPDMTPVKIYKVDPILSANGTTGVIRKQECKVVQNSVLNPYFTNNESPVIMMAECSVMKGNSGSAIVASDGRAHGIVSSITDVPAAKAEFLKQKNTDMKFSFGTNFSCVPLNFLGFSMDARKNCQIDISPLAQEKQAKKIYEQAIQAANKELEKKVAQVSQKFQIEGKPLFSWSIEQRDASEAERREGLIAKVQFTPLCLLPDLHDISRYRHRLKDAPVQVAVTLPQFRYLAGHDEYMRFKTQILDVSKSATATLNPSHLTRIKDIPVSFVMPKVGEGEFPQKEVKNLRLCVGR